MRTIIQKLMLNLLQTSKTTYFVVGFVGMGAALSTAATQVQALAPSLAANPSVQTAGKSVEFTVKNAGAGITSSLKLKYKCAGATCTASYTITKADANNGTVTETIQYKGQTSTATITATSSTAKTCANGGTPPKCTNPLNTTPKPKPTPAPSTNTTANCNVIVKNPDGTKAGSTFSDSGCTDPAAAGNGNCSNGLTSCDLLSKYINPFINFLSALVAVAVTISIIIGGIQYGSSGGDPSKVTAAKTRIRNSIIALVAFLFLYSFLNFLLPGGLL